MDKLKLIDYIARDQKFEHFKAILFLNNHESSL